MVLIVLFLEVMSSNGNNGIRINVTHSRSSVIFITIQCVMRLREEIRITIKSA